MTRRYYCRNGNPFRPFLAEIQSSDRVLGDDFKGFECAVHHSHCCERNEFAAMLTALITGMEPDMKPEAIPADRDPPHAYSPFASPTNFQTSSTHRMYPFPSPYPRFLGHLWLILASPATFGLSLLASATFDLFSLPSAIFGLSLLARPALTCVC